MPRTPKLTESEYMLRWMRASDVMHRVGVSHNLAYDRVRDLMRATDRLPTEKELASKLRKFVQKGMEEPLAKLILKEVRKPAPRRLAKG